MNRLSIPFVSTLAVLAGICSSSKKAMNFRSSTAGSKSQTKVNV